MIDDLAKVHPTIIERCKECTADRGYDDGKLIVKLWDDYKIKPVIDIRNLWKDQGCPAKHYGINCQGLADCPVAKGIRSRSKKNVDFLHRLPVRVTPGSANMTKELLSNG